MPDGTVTKTQLNFKDFTGKRFGMLVAVRHDYVKGRVRWTCRCDCGESIVIPPNFLTKGEAVSCGCKSRHGGVSTYYTPERITWRGIVQRCTNPNAPAYPKYGGRGITICERWRNSFEAFIADMGPRPADHFIDRIDNYRGYEPENCRWVTVAESNRNMRHTRYVDFRGERVRCTDLARRFNLPDYVIRHRIDWGWNTEEAVSTPVRPMAKRKKRTSTGQ